MNRNLKTGGTNIIFIWMDGSIYFCFEAKKLMKTFGLNIKWKFEKMIQHLDTLNSLVSINKILVSIHGKSEL